MMTLIREGGFPMWFILVFGLVALGHAAWFAARPDPRRLAFVKGMALTTLLATVVALAADLAAVFHTVPERFADDPKWHFAMLQGFAESMAPIIVGGTFLVLVSLLCTVGARRMPLLEGAQVPV